MNHRLPADVPKTGERYDLTLTSAGLDSRKKEVIMFVIDNGPHKGVRVSAFLTSVLKKALIAEADISPEDTSTRALDGMKYEVRISAVIDVTRLSKDSHGMYKEVTEDYKATNVYVHYDLHDFSFPAEESQLSAAFSRKEKKFTRKDTGKPAAKKTPAATKPKTKRKSPSAKKTS